MIVGLWLIPLEAIMSAGFTRATIFVKSQVTWCCFSVLLEDEAHTHPLAFFMKNAGSRFWWALGIGTFQPTQTHELNQAKNGHVTHICAEALHSTSIFSLSTWNLLFFITFINLSSIFFKLLIYVIFTDETTHNSHCSHCKKMLIPWDFKINVFIKCLSDICCLSGVPSQPTINLVVWERNYINPTVNNDLKRTDLVFKKRHRHTPLFFIFFARFLRNVTEDIDCWRETAKYTFYEVFFSPSVRWIAAATAAERTKKTAWKKSMLLKTDVWTFHINHLHRWIWFITWCRVGKKRQIQSFWVVMAEMDTLCKIH